MLALVTGLLVARPLVPGEDPGRLLLFTSSANQVLTCLWLLALVGWAAWRAWSQDGLWRGSPVELGLLAVAGLFFLSAQNAAAFKHPAWLIAWEWVGWLAAFCLIRQLVRSPRENRAVLSAILASGVSLAVFAVYQKVVPPAEAPTIDPTVAEIFGPDAFGPSPEEGVSATFARPSYFLSYLGLLAPPLLMALYLRFPRPRNWLAVAGGGVLLLLATPTTNMMVFGAYLAGAALLVMFGALVLRKRNGESDSAGALGLAAAAFLVLLVLAFTSENAATRLISAHPTLGVGPGNFGREALRLDPPDVVSLNALPDNPLLAVAATAGLWTLAALVLTLFAFFWLTRQSWCGPPPPPPKTPPQEEGPRRPDALGEFYAGGILGLTLAVMLTVDPRGANLLREGAETAGRSLIWFASFALFCGTPWTLRTFAGSIAAGVAVLLVLPGGFSCSSLAVPLWALAALAINRCEAGWTWDFRQWLALTLPMPVVAVVALIYILVGVYPAISADMEIASARRHYEQWRKELEPEWDGLVKKAVTEEDKRKATLSASGLLGRYIRDPLRKAADIDRGNPYPVLEWAYWSGKRWQLYERLEGGQIDPWQRDVQQRWEAEILAAYNDRRNASAYARENDPRGRVVDWTDYTIHISIYAPQLKSLLETNLTGSPRQKAEKDLQATYKSAAAFLDAYLPTDPNSPQLHFLLADAYFKAGDKAKKHEQAVKTQELDEKETVGRRKLTDKQREQVRDWLSEKAGG